MTIFSVLIDVWVFSLYTFFNPSGYVSVASVKAREKYLRQFYVLSFIALSTTILATILWGYGDLIYLYYQETNSLSTGSAPFLEVNFGEKSMELVNILTIVAIILGPIIGVQTQKWIEGLREKKQRQLSLFKTLMASRATTLSPRHVEALNMIDLEFSGSEYKDVTQAWKVYLDYLSSFPRGGTEAEKVTWETIRIDKLCDLLMKMGKALNYDFDEVYVKKGIYSPEAHGVLEQQNNQIREQLISLLSGNASLKMEISSFPVNEREQHEQQVLRSKMREVMRGDAPLSVKLVQNDGAGTESK